VKTTCLDSTPKEELIERRNQQWWSAKAAPDWRHLPVVAFDSTNSNGQALFGGINDGNYNLYATKDTVISDTTFFPIFLDSTVVTINMTIPNTLPVFTNLPDTILIFSNSNESITIWNFISDNESSDTTLVFDFNATPDTLIFSFNDTTGVLTISSEDGTYSGNVILRIRADDTYGGVTEDSILINFTNVTGIEEDCDLPPNPPADSCGIGTHEGDDIAGVVIDTMVETGKEYVGYAGLIGTIGVGTWLLFLI